MSRSYTHLQQHPSLISYDADKTTDENLTDENWELILNLCDKVQDEGEQGCVYCLSHQKEPLDDVSHSARNVVAAVLKRLTHRIPNVQLYALSLAESLSKNCGVELHRELASKAFTQGLEKLITDRVGDSPLYGEIVSYTYVMFCRTHTKK